MNAMSTYTKIKACLVAYDNETVIMFIVLMSFAAMVVEFWIVLLVRWYLGV